MSDVWDCDDWDTGNAPDDAPEDACDHDQADIDILIGRGSCHCGHTWWLSSEEIQAELRFMAEYAEHVAEEMSAPPASAHQE